MKPRILFCTVTSEPGHGGIARVSSLVWQTLQQEFPGDCERLVASSSPTGELTPADKLRFTTAVAERQIRGRCDAVFFDHLGLARVQRMVPRAARRPYGVFLHSVEAWMRLSPRRLETLKEAKLRVANSNYTAERIAAAHGDLGPVRVCHLSLAEETLAAGNETTRDHPVLDLIRPLSVLIAGRMLRSEGHKGHADLIRAWPVVLRDVAAAQLVIVGRGDGVAELQDLACKNGVSDHVLFTGFVDDGVLDAIYRRVAIFAMPSRHEGFGIVYLEAMLHRLACIGSVHDAAREIIADGETGFLVEPGGATAMAGRIVELLNDPDMRARFGERGQQRLHELFSPPQFHARFSGLLRELTH